MSDLSPKGSAIVAALSDFRDSLGMGEAVYYWRLRKWLPDRHGQAIPKG